jgi:hypothetical protein
MLHKITQTFQKALISLLINNNIINENYHGEIYIKFHAGKIIKFERKASLELA